MPCYHPLSAYKPKSGRLVFDERKLVLPRFHYEKVKVRCGQCIGCRIDRSRSWALRCVHEASLWSRNCFITLTYNNKHVDSRMSLNKRDFQLFMKRLRKHNSGFEPEAASVCPTVVEDELGRPSNRSRYGRPGGDCADRKRFAADMASESLTACALSGRPGPDAKRNYPIRYFHCGEYGIGLGRPHHHACLFNFDFDDRLFLQEKDGVRLYTSAKLQRLWSKSKDDPIGFVTVGDVTFESAAYIARYICKKVNGKKAEAHYARVDFETGEMYSILPEFCSMSRRPGIGRAWFEKYKDDLYSKDFVTNKGRKFRAPAYYDKLYGSFDSVDFENIKLERKANAKMNEKSEFKLLCAEKNMESKVKFLGRALK